MTNSCMRDAIWGMRGRVLDYPNSVPGMQFDLRFHGTTNPVSVCRTCARKIISLAKTGNCYMGSGLTNGCNRTTILASREWHSAFWNPGFKKRVPHPPPIHKAKASMNQADLLDPRPVRESQSEMAEFVLPNDANPLGALLGGRLMHWIDLAGALAAHRHSRAYVVTASVDHIDFLVPVHVGSLVILRSSVNRVFRTSMEVGVKVWVENYIQDKCEHVASAHLTFVAVDRKGGRVAVAPVVPGSEEEHRRYDDAGRRRESWRAEKERRHRNIREGSQYV